MKHKQYETAGTSALQADPVRNIPWEKMPDFYEAMKATKYIEAFQNVVETIPVNNSKILFEYDTWNFAPYSKIYDTPNFDFSGLPEELAEKCKFYVLYRISQKRKLSTIHGEHCNFKNIYTKITNKSGYKDIYTITTDDIISTIEESNVSAGFRAKLLNDMHSVCVFLIGHCRMSIPVDLRQIKELAEKYLKKARTIDTKTPNIPEEYFNMILNKAVAVMRDENAVVNMRMTAAAIVLLSQTGLRIQDLLALTADRLLTKTLKKSGFTVNYIRYTAIKPSKVGQPLEEFDIFCTEISAEAFLIMKGLRESIERENKGNALFVLSYPCTASLPYSNDVFYNQYYIFFYNYLREEATKVWEGITPRKHWADTWPSEKNTDVYVPETRQFRVHFCTTLYKKNVSLFYIRKYMGHLSRAMEGYYVRPKDTYQEDMEFSEGVIQEIAGEDTSLLGGNNLGEDIKKNIKQFIKENNLNVYTDIDEIMKRLGSKVVIRGKRGGACIKTSLLHCNQDIRTDQLMCAHNVCSNLFHFYYMLDVTYVDFQTLQQTYRATKDAGHTKAAQKELAKVKDLISRRLIPELDELEKELARKGYREIISRHPELIDIIENKEDIRKEASEWKTKKFGD